MCISPPDFCVEAECYLLAGCVCSPPPREGDEGGQALLYPVYGKHLPIYSFSSDKGPALEWQCHEIFLMFFCMYDYQV